MIIIQNMFSKGRVGIWTAKAADGNGWDGASYEIWNVTDEGAGELTKASRLIVSCGVFLIEVPGYPQTVIIQEVHHVLY